MTGQRSVLDRLRNGGRLMRSFATSSPEGAVYTIEPGGDYVEPRVAKRIRRDPHVVPSDDGLFPNVDQTWSWSDA